MSRVLQAQAGLFCLHLSSFGAMVPSQDCFSGWFFPGSVHAGNGTIQAPHQRTDPSSFRFKRMDSKMEVRWHRRSHRRQDGLRISDALRPV